MSIPAATPAATPAAPSAADASCTEGALRPIRFFHRGAVVEVAGVPPTTTVLRWLREHARAMGTKEGCNEGDCGACTVVVAELADRAEATGTAGARATIVGGLSLRPVNACLRYLPTLDGKALLTVEDLRAIAGGELHPVQQALVECHGSQCGFCTPGFAMSLFGLFKNAHAPSREQVDDALSGNLCRCTGYRPILEAAERMGEYDAEACGATGWRSPGVAADGSRIVSREEQQLAAALDALAHDATFDYRGEGQRWLAPVEADGLAEACAQHPQACLVAGATDVGLWITKQMTEAMGGKIVVESQPNVGSIFTVRLPLAPSDGSAPVQVGSSGETVPL